MFEAMKHPSEKISYEPKLAVLIWPHGQGKMTAGQGKVREKSGNFIFPKRWQPWFEVFNVLNCVFPRNVIDIWFSYLYIGKCFVNVSICITIWFRDPSSEWPRPLGIAFDFRITRKRQENKMADGKWKRSWFPWHINMSCGKINYWQH